MPTTDIDALWDFNDPVATEERFKALLAAYEAKAVLLTQIARTQGLQRRFEEAHATLDEAERLLPEGLSLEGVRYYLERGRVLNSSGKPAEAKPLFVKALVMAEGISEGLGVDAAHMLAIVTEGEEQLAWNLKALEMASLSSDPKAQKWLGSLYNNIGWTYHDAGDYLTALGYFEMGLLVRKEHNQRVQELIARWCVGRCLRSLGRVDEALAIQRELEAEYAKEVPSGYVFEEIGECLLAQGSPKEASPFFAKAHAILSQDPWLSESDPARIERLAQLGDIP